MFGTGVAAATEAADADAAQSGQSHVSPQLASDPAAGAGAVKGVTDEQSKEVGESEAATAQPAATRKKKTKKKSKRENEESPDVVESVARVKKSKKGKKAKGASGKQATQPVNLLGLDATDAPWANEPVPEEIAAQHVTQRPAQTVKKAEEEHMRTEGKSQLEGTPTVGSAPSRAQALALLSYGLATKQSKMHRSGHTS